MISNFLQQLKRKGWKQKDVAAKTGIRTSHISELFNGGKCSIDTVIKFAEAFQVSTDEVLGREPSKPRSVIIEKIEQLTEGDEELARAILRRAEDEKLIREVRGREGRAKAA